MFGNGTRQTQQAFIVAGGRWHPLVGGKRKHVGSEKAADAHDCHLVDQGEFKQALVMPPA